MVDLMRQIHGVFDVLTKSKNQDDIRNATAMLDTISFDSTFTEVFFTYITNAEIAIENRLSAALYLKNEISKNWNPEENDVPAHKILRVEVQKYIKDNMAKLLMMTPRKIGENLVELAYIIGKVQLNADWPSFLPEILTGLQSPSQDNHFVVLQTLKKLFKKYRFSFPSKELVEEMLFVLPQTGPVLLGMLKSYSAFLSESVNSGNKSGELLALDLIGLILHIFYSLNCVELPEFFEDSMSEWMIYFKAILEMKNTSENIVKCKTRVIKNITLYCEKYNSDFKDYLLPFFNLIWAQVESTTMEVEYDKLVANILKFMHTVVYNDQVKAIYTERMPTLFEKLIYPNIMINENDLEQFETSPDTYISNDLEEADTETRRRNCLNLIRVLSRTFPINDTVRAIVESEIEKYNSNPAANWASKVNAINLLIGTHANQYTLRTGATMVTVTGEEIQYYLKNIVFPELDKLDAATQEGIFVKVACVKYLFIFRNQIPGPWIMPVVSTLANLMKHPNQILSSYACSTVERFFFVKNAEKKNVISREALSSFLVNILEPLCGLLKIQQNLYGVKALYRVIQLSATDILPYSTTLAQMYALYLETAIVQAANQTFNYMLFECISLSIRNSKESESNVVIYEQHIMPILLNIISKNVPELISYAFQILSQFVLLRSELQPNYNVLMSSLMNTKQNWDNNMRYLIPGMIQYLRAYILKYSSLMAPDLHTLCEIFCKVLTLRLDECGFSFLLSLLTTFPIIQLQPHLKSIFTIIFTRMQNDKIHSATKQVPLLFSRGVLMFISTFVNLYGFEELKKQTDLIQANIIIMLLCSEAGRIKCAEGEKQRKEVLCAFCKILLSMERFDGDLLKSVVEGLVNLVNSGVRRGLMGMEAEDFSGDNMERMKHQQALLSINRRFLSRRKNF